MKRLATIVLVGLMAACSKKEPPPSRIPVLHGREQYPITHGFSNMSPAEDNWEITDPKFAHWIERHCYVVKAEALTPHVIEGKELYAIKCDTDTHSDIQGQD